MGANRSRPVRMKKNVRFLMQQNASTPMRAVWNATVLAESDDTVVVEGNHYFPPTAIRCEHFEPSDHHTTCPWKGQASYYDVVVGGDRNAGAAWYYPETKPKAEEIRGRVAFWRGVKVEPVS